MLALAVFTLAQTGLSKPIAIQFGFDGTPGSVAPALLAVLISPLIAIFVSLIVDFALSKDEVQNTPHSKNIVLGTFFVVLIAVTGSQLMVCYLAW